MRNTHRSLLVVSLLALAFAVPAGAEVFTVTLNNDAEFKTRYQPQQDPNSDDKVMILTEFGNWISLHKSIISEIVSETESRGFGTVLDTNTIVIGWAPNDAPSPSEEAVDPTTRLMNYLTSRDSQRQDFSVQQFVTTESAGQGGLPAAGAAVSGNTSFPVFGGGGTIANEPQTIDQ
jgi:hypothetical protein